MTPSLAPPLLLRTGVKLLAMTLTAVLLATSAAAQVLPPPAKGDREALQHGAQPNPNEMRPGSRAGDAPSAPAGAVVTRPGRRVLGLPITAALVSGGLLIALVVVAGVVIPGATRRRRARGGGTYGGPQQHSQR